MMNDRTTLLLSSNQKDDTISAVFHSKDMCVVMAKVKLVPFGFVARKLARVTDKNLEDRSRAA
jgi:hypothetical protein